MEDVLNAVKNLLDAWDQSTAVHTEMDALAAAYKKHQQYPTPPGE